MSEEYINPHLAEKFETQHASIKVKIINFIKRWRDYFRKDGFYRTYIRAYDRVFYGNGNRHSHHWWTVDHALEPETLEAQRNTKFDYEPKFSIVVPMYKTNERFLGELISSVRTQTYSNFELCLADGSCDGGKLRIAVEKFAAGDNRIKYKELENNGGIAENTNAAIEMATGDFIVFCDHDDVITQDALFECAKIINENPDAELIYSDQDIMDSKGKFFYGAFFKPDYSPDYLCSMNYISHLHVIKKTLLDEIGYLSADYDGSQDYDLTFRACEKAKKVCHIPRILYHWRANKDSTADNPENKLYAFENGKKAIEDHYKRLGLDAEVAIGGWYGLYHTKFRWPESPLLSIIIPNKDHIDDLKLVMGSIDEKSTYKNYEYIIVENNSTEQETFDYYEELKKRENVTIAYFDGPFNYSKINNFGATFAKGDYFLLLNNDIEMIAPDAIEQMMSYIQREDVGIVGAKLRFADDTIQHAGVVMGLGGAAANVFTDFGYDQPGNFFRLAGVSNYSAVTAACLLVKKSLFEQVNGLDEDFVVAYNDVDFCLRVRETGALVVYQPKAEFYHYESKSRGYEDDEKKRARFAKETKLLQERWAKYLHGKDPYYNPNLTLDYADFSTQKYDRKAL